MMSRQRINAKDHPPGTRCLLSENEHAYSFDTPFEATVAEWSPAGRVKLRRPDGREYWYSKTYDMSPWIVEVLTPNRDVLVGTLTALLQAALNAEKT